MEIFRLGFGVGSRDNGGRITLELMFKTGERGLLRDWSEEGAYAKLLKCRVKIRRLVK